MTEPVYASTSASVSETSGQRQQFNGVSPFIQQQFPAQVSDTIQLPSSSQVLHIRASDGSEVQSDQGSINEEISTRQSGLTSEAILSEFNFYNLYWVGANSHSNFCNVACSVTNFIQRTNYHFL